MGTHVSSFFFDAFLNSCCVLHLQWNVCQFFVVPLVFACFTCMRRKVLLCLFGVIGCCGDMFHLNNMCVCFVQGYGCLCVCSGCGGCTGVGVVAHVSL